MAYQYSTQLISGFFDTLTVELVKGGAPTLVITNAQGEGLVEFTLPVPIVLKKEGSVVTLNPPPSEMVLKDGEAVSASISNGLGQKVVTFNVGSLATNPSAAMLITSTSLFAGGMITINSIELTF